MQKNRLLIIIITIFIAVLIGVGVFLFNRSAAVDEVTLDAVQKKIDEGQFADARTELTTILETESDNAEAHFLMGLALFNLGEYAEAEDQFLRSMEIEPDRSAAVHHNLGVLAFQMGDMQTALNEFQSALDEDPGDADSHYQLGATYLVMAFPIGAVQPDPELLQQSEDQFNLSLKASPDKPEALVGLANVYMLKSDLSQAISLLEKAVETQPDMREALFALGRAYAFAGQMSEAETTLKRFLDTDPPAQWKQQAEELLTQLE